jgi:5-(carboxyamino)imidazole ribonucleotide synthase
MPKVGVIGGGQLAWMLSAAAEKLAIQLVIQTPTATDPAASIASQLILADVEDVAGTRSLAQVCDVVTFENEFVDLVALQDLGDRFRPSLASLAPLLDKADQRHFLQTLGLPTPDFEALTGEPSRESLTQFGFPVVLKARRHGYDGYGTFICRDEATLIERLSQGTDWLLEEFVSFDRELAVMAARSPTGEVAIYPIVETQQENQVCRRVFVGAGLFETDIEAQRMQKQVGAIAHTLLDGLDYVGVMGIEFFLTQAKQLLVNETAPRTHNSGHYSLDAAVTSQFEQQLRVVCGLPLGDPSLKGTGAVMVNLLGFERAESDYLDLRQQIAAIPNAHLYWYGKTVARPGRKLGHVTVLLEPGQGRKEMEAIAQMIEAIWYRRL